MPCRDWEGFEINQRLQNERKAVNKATKLQSQNNRLSKFLCSLLTELKNNHKEVYKSVIKSDKDLNQWWIKHQKLDKRYNSKK